MGDGSPIESHSGVGAPPILEPILVGIGMFTGDNRVSDPWPNGWDVCFFRGRHSLEFAATVRAVSWEPKTIAPGSANRIEAIASDSRVMRVRVVGSQGVLPTVVLLGIPLMNKIVFGKPFLLYHRSGHSHSPVRVCVKPLEHIGLPQNRAAQKPPISGAISSAFRRPRRSDCSSGRGLGSTPATYEGLYGGWCEVPCRRST